MPDLPERFDAVNAERHRLLDKKYTSGLSRAEEKRLQEVTDDVDEMLKPWYTEDMKRLRQIIEECEAALKKLRETEA